MKKEAIEKLIGDTTELTVSTKELVEKTVQVLNDTLYNEEEATLIIRTLIDVLNEVGNKMPKYLIHCTCSKLLNTDLEPTKIEKWYETLIEE